MAFNIIVMYGIHSTLCRTFPIISIVAVKPASGHPVFNPNLHEHSEIFTSISYQMELEKLSVIFVHGLVEALSLNPIHLQFPSFYVNFGR